MERKTCCVTGHRNLPQSETERIKAALQAEVESAVADGFTRFMSGFAEGIDQLFAEIVLDVKSAAPAIELVAVIPSRDRLNSLKSKSTMNKLLEQCAEVTVTQEKYHPGVFARRNLYMVEHSARVIAVYDGREKGGTASTIRLARAANKEVREIPAGPQNV